AGRDPSCNRSKGGQNGSRPAPDGEVSLGVEPVEPGDVAAGDFEDVLGAGVLEVAGDDLLRFGPGRGLVRVVAGPHHAVDADELATLHPDMIEDIGGPHLPREILARLQLY